MYEHLKNFDREVYEAIVSEGRRQQDKLEMIASENFVSEAVLDAQGSLLTNKYAEGLPAKRYYGGCEYVDIVENLAIERLKKLFGAEHANVQPHSGASANTAVYFAVLEPGDKILGMDLSHGGHLTHGMMKNISGRYYESHFYQVHPETEQIDYDALEQKALEVKPKMIVAGASAYPRTIDFARFRAICDKVGAYLFVDMAHIAGLVAAGLHPNPVPYADFVTTTTHKTLRGPRGGVILCKQEYAKKIDSAVFPGTQGGPLMHVIAAKAVAFKEALEPSFVDYQKQVIANAKCLARVFQEKGVRVVSGGTDNHLLLLDLRAFNISGFELQVLLDEINITTNKNSIPFDTTKSHVTSGLRLGTPALTTRGMKEKEMEEIADIIFSAMTKTEDEESLRQRVAALCKAFPLYENY